MPNRRAVLFGAGSAIVAGFFGWSGLTRENEVDARPIPDPGKPGRFDYRGRKVQIDESSTMAMARIDDRAMVHIERTSDRKYHSHLLPFQDYADVKRLMYDLIDREAEQLFIL